MGLFGIIQKDETDTKRAEQVVLEKYNKKVEHYSKSLEHFDEVVNKLELMITDYESKDHAQQVSNVNLVLDLKYLKEQGDQTSERLLDVSEVQLRELKKQIDTSYCIIEEINRELEQENEEKTNIEVKVHKNQRLLRAVLIFQFFILGGLIVTILNLFGIIV